MKRGEERGREERKEKSPPPPVTHARVPESKGERRRRERDLKRIEREKRERSTSSRCESRILLCIEFVVYMDYL